jgi:pyroglutamyl-peptidase
VDLFIHLGEARGWNFVTVERVAYKQGMSSSWWGPNEEKQYYTMADNAGLTIKDVGPCPWDEVPMGLRSACKQLSYFSPYSFRSVTGEATA